MLPAVVGVAWIALVFGMLLLGTEAPAGAAERAAAGSASCPTGNPFAPAQLERDVRFLAAPERGGRAPGSAGDRQTRGYIEARFRCLGLTPAGEDGGFQKHFTTSEGDRTASVIGYLPASDPARRKGAIVVGAHHDHIGRRGKRIYRGANDNASGTAGLMAVAAQLSRREQPLKRPVIFASFGAEETLKTGPFLEGSVRFLIDPPLNFKDRDFAFMANMDMIGTYRNRDEAHVFGPRRGDSAYRAIRSANAAGSDLRIRFPGNAGPGLSDYWPFQRIGIPTAFFHTPDGICLHKFCDRPGRLDYGPMGKLAGLVGGTVERMAGR